MSQTNQLVANLEYLKARAREQRWKNIRANLRLFTSNRMGMIGVYLLLLVALLGVSHYLVLAIGGEEYHPVNLAQIRTESEVQIDNLSAQLREWQKTFNFYSQSDATGKTKALNRYRELSSKLQMAFNARLNEIQARINIGEESYTKRKEEFQSLGFTGNPPAQEPVSAPPSTLQKGSRKVVDDSGRLINSPQMMMVAPSVPPATPVPATNVAPENQPTPPPSPTPNESEPTPQEADSDCTCEETLGVERMSAIPVRFGEHDPLYDLTLSHDDLLNSINIYQEKLARMARKPMLNVELSNSDTLIQASPKERQLAFVETTLDCAYQCQQTQLTHLREEIQVLTSRLNTYEQLLYPTPRGPTLDHWLGVDVRGIDIFSQFTNGALIAITLGVVCAILAVLIGMGVGLISGYAGGTTDSILMRVVDIFLAMPTLPVLIVVTALLEDKSLIMIGFLIVIFAWPSTARVIRSQVLSLKTRPFVENAKINGASTFRIILRHIAPNVLPLALLAMTFAVNGAIISEAGLSALGLGDENSVSWGYMLYKVKQTGNLENALYWLLPPGLGILVICLGFLLIGRAMDEIINPRLRKRGA